jgi:hypothetical protein
MPDGNAIDLIPIADQVARGLIPRECLCDLALGLTPEIFGAREKIGVAA